MNAANYITVILSDARAAFARAESKDLRLANAGRMLAGEFPCQTA